MAFVEFEQRGHVGLITINRPEVLNALNLEVIEQLDDILLRAESQEDVHVIVITGAGRSFVAGADIGEMVNYTADDAKRFSHHGNNTMMHITRFPSPVIAAVNGFALGGGCEMALACDIRIASEKAKFGQPEVGLGIIPGFGGTQRMAFWALVQIFWASFMASSISWSAGTTWLTMPISRARWASMVSAV